MSQATALLADAESSISSGAWDQALDQLENVKQSEPQEPNVYRKLAHVQAIRGKFRSVVATYVDLVGVLVEAEKLNEAEEVIGSILALQPECEEAREKRIQIEKKRGNIDRAVYLARELARLCIEQGDGDRSIRLLQDAQSDQPENLDISLELAEMFVSHGQIQDGANQYRKVANAFQEAGNISKAAEAYRRMKVVQSDDPDVLLTLGRLYTELGKLDEAEQEFRSVLRHDLEHQDALLELGLVCQLKGRFRSGLLAFNKVLQNNPKLPRAMRKLGELNLSMGKQSEAVQHFLEAAQAYLETEERDEAVELFQVVLGVEEGNAQAQQGLTNLGAPLEAKEFQPPLPPTPPDDEPPTPGASPMSATELGEMPPAQVPSEPDPEPEPTAPQAPPPKAEKPKKASNRSTESPRGPGGRRKGLVSGGLGLRKGLVDPSAGGGKPMLGKPTLGGSGGSTRAGLRRPGLGMKGGGEKPMMGMKPTLERRRPAEPEPAPMPEQDVFAPEESVFSSEEGVATEPLESLFDNADEDAGGAGLDLSAAANDLFDSEPESPFGDESMGSIFDSDDSDAPAPAAPVIGAFGGQDSGDSLGDEPSGLQPGFNTELSLDSDGEAADDIFGGGGDLFGDDDSSDGNLFDDDSLPGGGLFDDDSSGAEGGDLFSGLDAPAEEPVSESPAAEGEDPFGGDQFGSLFDEPGEDKISTSATIGSMGGGALAKDLFSSEEDQAAESAPVEDSAFDSLFSDAPAEGGGDDLFATEAPAEQNDEPAAEPGGLFDEPSEGTDLFGEDLFPDASAAPTESLESQETPGDDLFGGGDLFADESPAQSELIEDSPALGEGLFETVAEPDAGGGLFEEAPVAGDSLFDEPAESDDLFGSGNLFDEPAAAEASEEPLAAEAEEEFSLFSEPGEDLGGADSTDAPLVSESDTSSLFEGFDQEEPAPAGDAFTDDVSGGSLFDEPAPGGSLFDEPEAELGGDDLFSEMPSESPASELEETSLDLGGGGLFDDVPTEEPAAPEESADLFDIPAPVSDNLFDEPSETDASGGLFDAPEPSFDAPPDELSSGGLFDEPEPAAPLDLDLPMPGDAPLEVEAMDDGGGPESVEDDLFSEPALAVEEIDEDALTMDKLRAEVMTPDVEVPAGENAESPEFMKLLELTLPKSEEEAEPVVEPVEEPVMMVEPEVVEPEEGDLFDSPGLDTEEGDLFDNAQEDLFEELPEPEPVDEGPEILGKPIVSLSIEDESPAEDISVADQLDASLGETDVATKIAGYRKALEDAPNNLVMRTRLADIHLKYGMLQDALLQYRQVIKKNTESISLLHRVIQAEFWTENYAEAGESLLVLAKLHLKRGEQHDALDTLQSVLSLDAHHFEARKVLVSVFSSLEESKLAAHHLRQLAETAMTKGEVDEAISAFQQLLEISNDPVFEERLGQIYESQGDMEKALTSFQALVGRYQAEERWEEAARVTERIVELNPELLDDRGALVELYKKLGMTGKAMEQQFKLARLYQEKGQLPASIGLYEGVLEYSTENQEARRLLVDAYLDSSDVSAALRESEALTEHYLTTKDHQTAIELYTRLVEADSENVELQERLVKFYGLAGDPESAKVRWIQLADLHESRERFVKAAEAIQKALELDENQIELQHRLALLYTEKVDDKVAALTQLRKLFQMAPDRLDAVKMYIDILLTEEQVSEAGQVLQQMEQAGGESVKIKNDVITSLRNKVEGNPGDLKARFNYGELCYHLGDLDHAIEQFQQTRRNPEFELQSYNMLGLCFAKKKGFNMLDLAIKQFKKGLETKGRSEQSYLELRYNLAMIQYQNGRISESLADFQECYRVDITYRDVRSWIEKIESELASSGS